MSKAKYLISSVYKRLFNSITLTCPSCGWAAESVVDRKALVTSLARCGGCKLLFRQPHTLPEESRKFYQQEYKQGYTTDLPDQAALKIAIEAGFKNTERDYSRHLDIFEQLAIKPPARIFEFGCSWGYGAWQMVQAGFQVKALEVSGSRCLYARENLGIDAVGSISEVRGRFDVVFSSHVLEHVDRIGDVLENLSNLLRPGGWMIHLMPNGSDDYKAIAFPNWHQLWGEAHPQLPDARFWCNWFGTKPFFMSATPINLSDLAEWDCKECKIGRLNGGELLIVAKKPSE